MYNGIGLMTPRGSGTSGYVQKNLSHMRKVNNRDDFLKEIQRMKENVIDARKKINPDILLHEQKRDIEVKKLILREELEGRGMPESEIEEKVQRLEKRLKEQLEKGDYLLENTEDTHALTKLKEVQEKKIGDAFGVRSHDYKPGSAFDFDTQEKERLEKQYQKELQKADRLEKLKEMKKAEKKQLKEQSKLQAQQSAKQLTDGVNFKLEADKKNQKEQKSKGKKRGDSEDKKKKRKH